MSKRAEVPGDDTKAAAFLLAVRLFRRRAATTMLALAIARLRVRRAIVRIRAPHVRIEISLPDAFCPCSEENEQ
jgi:hypothetical protein